jgi:hypothetical protein
MVATTRRGERGRKAAAGGGGLAAVLHGQRAVALCAVLALALRAPFAGVALGRDEGGLTFIARQWPGGHGSLYGAYWLDRPPLLVALFKLAGGQAGVRALGAVAAVALVVAVAALASALGADGRVAGLFAALLTGCVAIGAVSTPAELLAAVPSTLSVLCLIRGRHLLVAGLLAGAALLIKQSFVDAAAAGLVFLALRRPRAWWTYLAGLALPLTVLALPGYLDALVGFRLHALTTLQGSGVALPQRMERIAPGLVAAAVIAGLGLRRVPDRVPRGTLAAWFVAGAAGVLAGGSYWPHYLIELVPVTCVAAALLRPGAPVVAGVAAAFVAVAVAGGVHVRARPPQRAARAAARYVRAHARAGDTQYVLYARANVLEYAGLPSPYPYAWSLMVRARPGAIPRLRRLLASPRRPTWVVGWQPTTQWGLDRDGRTARLLATHYRRAAVVDGHPIYRAR